MKSRLFIIAAACAVSMPGVAALAEDTAPEAAATPAPKAVEKEKQICRRETSGTGSIMPKRICHTKAQWDMMAQAAGADVDRIRAMERARREVSNR